jgi:hypothetical protein
VNVSEFKHGFLVFSHRLSVVSNQGLSYQPSVKEVSD